MKKGQNLRQQLIKSFMGVGAMYVLSIPLGLLTSVILARTLEPQGFGQYAFVMSLLSLMALPAAGGLPQLLTREVATFSHAEDWPLYRGVVRAAHIWVFLVALLLMAAYFITGPIFGLIPTESKWALLGIVILLVPLEGFNEVRNGTIKGLGFPALAELPTQTVRPVLLLLAIVVLAWTGQLNIRSALWAQVGVVSVSFVVASILFFRIRPKASLDSRPIYRYRGWMMALLPFTLISLVGTFNAQVGIVLLGLLGTDEAVAALRVAERGAQLVALSLGLVNMVISPHIVRTYHEGNNQRLQQLSRQSARGAFLFALPIGLVLIVFGRPIIHMVFGEAYVDTAYLPMVILVIGQLFNVAMGSVGMLLAMSGHEKLTLASYIAALAVTAIFAYLLTPVLQQVGAAVAVTLGVLVVNVITAYSVMKTLKIRPGIL